MPDRGASLLARRTLTIVVLYGLVVLAAPFFHHDFACHQSSRSHCTSCVSSQSAPNVAVSTPHVSGAFLVAGHIHPQASAHSDSPALSSFSGRSPPDALL